MARRVIASILLVALALLMPSGTVTAIDAPKPNVVLIVTDDTPYTSLVRFYDYEDLLDQGGQTKPQAGVEAGNKARELVKGAEQR